MGGISAGNVVAAPISQNVRRSHILDAAEACFVRNGFHHTTMIDLAREAHISPGNFYRYFPSKEAIVLALAQRDRERGAALIAEIGRTGDLQAVLMGVLARYFFELTHEAAVLRLDFWAEATRNPAIAAMVSAGDAEGRAWLTKMFGALAISPSCDPSAMVEILSPVMKGMVIDRALRLDYDPAPVVKHLRMLIEAGLNGCLSREKE